MVSLDDALIILYFWVMYNMSEPENIPYKITSVKSMLCTGYLLSNTYYPNSLNTDMGAGDKSPVVNCMKSTHEVSLLNMVCFSLIAFSFILYPYT